MELVSTYLKLIKKNKLKNSIICDKKLIIKYLKKNNYSINLNYINEKNNKNNLK